MQGQLVLTCLFKLFFVYCMFDVTRVFAVAGAKCVQSFCMATLGLKVCVCTPCLLSGALLSPSLFAVLYAGTAVDSPAP